MVKGCPKCPWPRGRGGGEYKAEVSLALHSGPSHCPQGKCSVASSALPISPTLVSAPTLGSRLMEPQSVPRFSSFVSLGQPIPSVCSVLTSACWSFLLLPWVSAEVSPPPGSLPWPLAWSACCFCTLREALAPFLSYHIPVLFARWSSCPMGLGS